MVLKFDQRPAKLVVRWSTKGSCDNYETIQGSPYRMQTTSIAYSIDFCTSIVMVMPVLEGYRAILFSTRKIVIFSEP